jgi:hypothetical protein
MNSSMTQIRERNMEIGKYSESTRLGAGRLQRTMRDASDSLGRFRLGTHRAAAETRPVSAEDLERIAVAPRVYREADMTAMERADRVAATV